MKLGLLAFDAGDSYDITDIVAYAMKAEASNFHRFWLGEHYTRDLWANPEVLIPVILGMTERMSIGAAGILLRVHSSYRVAQSFKMMNSFFPGRVDLGIAKGGVLPDIEAHLMDCKSYEAHSVDEKIAKIFDYYANEDALLEKDIYMPPHKYPTPNVWLLGVGNSSLHASLNYKCGFSKSLFHDLAKAIPFKDELAKHRELYFNKYGELPKVNVAFAGILGNSMKDAQKRYENSIYIKNDFVNPNLIGCKNYFQDTLLKYQEDFDVDEFVFLDLSPTMKNKMDSLEVLGELFSTVEHQ